MALAQSKVTAQGQISVPAAVRQKLGIGPGALLEWDEVDGAVIVRRVGRYSSEDVHHAIFGDVAPRQHSLDDLKEGIRRHSRTRHARDWHQCPGSSDRT